MQYDVVLSISASVWLLKIAQLTPNYDATHSGRMTFQRPATQTMSYLVDLHHDIFAVLLFLCILVFYWLIQTAYKFRSTNTSRGLSFTAHTGLEIA